MTNPDLVILRLDHLIDVLSVWTGVRPEHLRPGNLGPAFFGRLRSDLNSDLLGQCHAIEAATAALRRRHSLPEPAGVSRPLWTAIFGGPSGVGKSALAHRLAARFWGSESALIQIDCSELDQEHTLARLVGAPPGYVGYRQGGQLCNDLRRVSSGVILFDEIEKAHPALLRTLLLPLLGEGTVHDMSSGERLDATRFAVILTSNLGAQHPGASPGFLAPDERASERQRTATTGVISAWLPREIAGRIDDVIVFNHLDADSLCQIWDRDLRQLEERIRQSGVDVRLVVEPAVRDLLLARYESDLRGQGARALRRAFDHELKDRCLELLTTMTTASAELHVAVGEQSELLYELEQA